VIAFVVKNQTNKREPYRNITVVSPNSFVNWYCWFENWIRSRYSL